MPTTMDGVLRVILVMEITKDMAQSMWDAMLDGMERGPIVSVLVVGFGFNLSTSYLLFITIFVRINNK
jgi:hypothetical protein